VWVDSFYLCVECRRSVSESMVDDEVVGDCLGVKSVCGDGNTHLDALSCYGNACV